MEERERDRLEDEAGERDRGEKRGEEKGFGKISLSHELRVIR